MFPIRLLIIIGDDDMGFRAPQQIIIIGVRY